MVEPSWLMEVIWLMPAMRPNMRSRGVATAVAMVSGLAPGRLADDLNDGISHFRQGSDRKHAISERTRQKQPEGQQGSRDRTANEWSRNIHRVSFSLVDPA